MGLCTIKRSSEFQRVRGGLRAANSSFVIETRVRTPASVVATESQSSRTGQKPDPGSLDPGSATLEKACSIQIGFSPRFGFTVTRKIGNAVVRNRIRRRFKEALRSLESGIIAPGHDYVVIARPGVIEMPFAELKQLLAVSIAGLHRPRPAGTGDHRQRYSGAQKSGRSKSGQSESGKSKSGKSVPEQPRSGMQRSQKHHPAQPSYGEAKPEH